MPMLPASVTIDTITLVRHRRRPCTISGTGIRNSSREGQRHHTVGLFGCICVERKEGGSVSQGNPFYRLLNGDFSLDERMSKDLEV